MKLYFSSILVLLIQLLLAQTKHVYIKLESSNGVKTYCDVYFSGGRDMFIYSTVVPATFTSFPCDSSQNITISIDC